MFPAKQVLAPHWVPKEASAAKQVLAPPKRPGGVMLAQMLLTQAYAELTHDRKQKSSSKNVFWGSRSGGAAVRQ